VPALPRSEDLLVGAQKIMLHCTVMNNNNPDIIIIII
jgi:hypothetical protein